MSDAGLARRVVAELRPHWRAVGALLLLNLLATPLMLLLPLPLKIAVDSALGGRPLPGALGALPLHGTTPILAFAALLQIGVVVANELQTLASYVLLTRTGERITMAFRAHLFRHVQRLSIRYHDARGSADSLYRIQYDAPSIQHLTIYGALPLFTSFVSVCAMISVIARLNWRLAAIALAVTPVLFALATLYRAHVKARYSVVKDIESRALGVVQEALGAIRVVKAFGREEREYDRFRRQSGDAVHARVRIAVFDGGFSGLVNVTVALGTALTLFFGARSVAAGAMSTGDLLLVLGYLVQLYAPISNMSRQVAALQSSLVSAQRAFETLELAPDIADGPGARPLARARGELRVERVSFGYDERRAVLRDVSLTIPAGTRLGIAGPTGAGKTTLISLLTRFYDPLHGRVLLDGTDIREIRIDDLRKQFAIVLQEPVLFSTTLRENIAYARPEASEAEIVAAARAANAHDFICALPDRYETTVGERGARLSGGERQRIALARAFLKDAPILVLDEPTSSVDVQTEAAIMEAMERLMSGRTTIMIAHRLSTLAACDRRIELREGDAIERDAFAVEA